MYRTLTTLLAAGGLLLLAVPARCDNYSMPKDSDPAPNNNDGKAFIQGFSGEGNVYIENGVTVATFGGGPAPGKELNITKITFDTENDTRSVTFPESYYGYLYALSALDNTWYPHSTLTV